MDTETKMKLFNKMLELEHLSDTQRFDGGNYYEQASGAFEMLQAVGLGKEYVEWAFGK